MLGRVVDDLRDAPEIGTFLVNTFFPEVSISREEAVYFDVLTGKARLAPFVSPLVEGQIVESLGYKTNSFTPAYIKDKRVLEDGKAIRRRPGMPISAGLDPMAIRMMTIETESEDQIRMVRRRMEWMAASALRTGTITVAGEKYPTTVVNFGRDPSLTVTLTGADLWGSGTDTPLEDLEEWSGLVRNASGASPVDVVMAQNVFTVFRRNADVKALLESDRGSPLTTLDLGPNAYRYGATYIGNVGAFRIWVYADSYVADDGSTQKYVPDDYLLLISDRLEGVQHFGGIKDEQAGFQVADYYQKSWTQPDPAVRFLMLQSAPLVVPYRVNACLSAKVK
ncbi:major capsid protein [Methylobacterium planeticum]|uniref:major capsid protein n=1 Tax=Methylobacterium planeticum TaxID=2615211 RepID=UPI001782CD65|nr:major capsid protein [Methylobacterium planeticum]